MRSLSTNLFSIMLSSMLIFGQVGTMPHRHDEKDRRLLSFFAQSQVLYLTDPSVLHCGMSYSRKEWQGLHKLTKIYKPSMLHEACWTTLWFLIRVMLASVNSCWQLRWSLWFLVFCYIRCQSIFSFSYDGCCKVISHCRCHQWRKTTAQLVV